MGNYTPVHEAFSQLTKEMVNMLPAIHAITGYDTTSKVGTKKKAIINMKNGKHLGLVNFGTAPVNDKMVTDAEKFLIDYLPKYFSSADSFDSIRYHNYHSSDFKSDLEKFSCCSSTLR